jgi:hypothetical protein
VVASYAFDSVGEFNWCHFVKFIRIKKILYEGLLTDITHISPEILDTWEDPAYAPLGGLKRLKSLPFSLSRSIVALMRIIHGVARSWCTPRYPCPLTYAKR